MRGSKPLTQSEIDQGIKRTFWTDSVELSIPESLKVVEELVKFLGQKNNEVQQHIRSNKDKENQRTVQALIKYVESQKDVSFAAREGVKGGAQVIDELIALIKNSVIPEKKNYDVRSQELHCCTCCHLEGFHNHVGGNAINCQKCLCEKYEYRKTYKTIAEYSMDNN